MVARSEAGSGESATRATILDAARRRFSRFGPRKTTMAEVARDAGCARATLYLHFDGKERLYAGLLESETRVFVGEMEAAVAASRSARRKLRAILETTGRIYSGDSALGTALAGDEEFSLDAVARSAVEDYEQQVVEILEQVLDQGVAEGDFRRIDTRAVAHLMYQLGRALVLRELSGRSQFEFDRILRVMDDVVAHGIAAEASR